MSPLIAAQTSLFFGINLFDVLGADAFQECPPDRSSCFITLLFFSFFLRQKGAAICRREITLQRTPTAKPSRTSSCFIHPYQFRTSP